MPHSYFVVSSPEACVCTLRIDMQMPTDPVTGDSGSIILVWPYLERGINADQTRKFVTRN